MSHETPAEVAAMKRKIAELEEQVRSTDDLIRALAEIFQVGGQADSIEVIRDKTLARLRSDSQPPQN
jgi:hypothetical protein